MNDTLFWISRDLSRTLERFPRAIEEAERLKSDTLVIQLMNIQHDIATLREIVYKRADDANTRRRITTRA